MQLTSNSSRIGFQIHDSDIGKATIGPSFKCVFNLVLNAYGLGIVLVRQTVPS